MSINGGAAVAHAQPDDADLCIRETDCFVACAVACGRHEQVHHSQMRHREITPPPPSDRLHPSQPDSSRPDIGGPVAFQSPSVLRKDTWKTSEIPIVDRR